MAGGIAARTETTTARLGFDPKVPPKPRDTNYQTGRDPFSRRLSALNIARGYVLDEWMEITDQIRPRRGAYLTGTGPQNRLNRRSNKIINSTASIASRTCGSGMMSGVSSPSRPWFAFRVNQPGLEEVGPVKQWLYESTQIVSTVLAKSNFYDQVQTMYRDGADFGTSPMVVDEDFEDVIRCTVLAPGEYYLACSSKGRPNTLYREYKQTVLQLVQEYGYDNVSKRVKDLYNKGHDSLDQQIEVVMAIEPNLEQVQGLPGPKGWPYVCVYFEKKMTRDDDKNKFLRKTGYREWPVAVMRWDVQAGEDYGSGPGLDALGDTRALQELEREKGKAIKKLVTPPVQSPAGPTHKVSHLPGATVHLPATASQAAMIKPLYEVAPAGINAIANEIQRHEDRVKTVYYADLFLMLLNDPRQQPATAREIAERHEEKLLNLGPVLERLHNEGLNVALERVFMICMRNGLIPPPPPEIRGALKIEYTSILAQAQRAVNVSGIERFVGFIGNMAAVRPEVLDKPDWDQVVDEYGSSLQVPPAIIRSDDAVQEERRASQAAMAQQQAAATAPDMAKSAELLSRTRLGTGSALDIITGQAGATANPVA